MALTLPYPTMSGSFSPTGAATVDQFAPETVHNDSAHNNPHAKLLANDVAIKAYVDALGSSIGLLGFSQTNVVTSAVLTSSFVSLISLVYSKVSSSVLFVFSPFIASKAGGGGLSNQSYKLYVDGVNYDDTLKTVSIFDTGSSGMATGRIFTGLSSGLHTIALYGKYDAGSATPGRAEGIQLIVLELGQ
jgi:hypothetical protein